MNVKRLSMMLVAMLAAGCAPRASQVAVMPAGPQTAVPHPQLRGPQTYSQAFAAPRDRTLSVTEAALRTFGLDVAFEDRLHGVLKTAPKLHRLRPVPADAPGTFVPCTHSYVISVQEDAPGHSVVSGYIRTFDAEHEVTMVLPQNSGIQNEMWERLFREIASDLR